MPAGVDGVAHGQAEIELDVGVDEGRDKGAAGPVHVDAHIPALLLVEVAWHMAQDSGPGWKALQGLER